MHKESDKFGESTVLEGITSIRALIDARRDPGSRNDRPIERILFDEERLRKIGKEVGWLRAVGREYDFPVLPAPREEIERLATGTTHGGLLAVCGQRILPPLSECDILPDGFYAMIEGVEDPYNFGYALRSLYACGLSGAILTERNWMSAAGVVARASAGASERLSLFTADPCAAAALFRRAGYRIVAADVNTETSLPCANMKKPLFLLIGGEKRGLSQALSDMADLTVRIPYGRRFDAALSAASAATILGYEVLRQNLPPAQPE